MGGLNAIDVDKSIRAPKGSIREEERGPVASLPASEQE